jgi:hypothetical protein
MSSKVAVMGPLKRRVITCINVVTALFTRYYSSAVPHMGSYYRNTRDDMLRMCYGVELKYMLFTTGSSLVSRIPLGWRIACSNRYHSGGDGTLVSASGPARYTGAFLDVQVEVQPGHFLSSPP